MKYFLLVLCFCSAISVAGESAVEYSVALDNVKFSDLARVVYGDILKKNYTLDSELIEAAESVSVNWKNLKKSQVQGLMDELSLNRGFQINERHGVVFVQSRQKLEDEVFVYVPKFRAAKYLEDIVVSVTDARLPGTKKNDGLNPLQQVQAVQMVEPQQWKPVAVDRVVLSVARVDLVKVKKLLADLDVPGGELILKAAVYEVASARGEGGAVQVAAKLVRDHVNAAIGGVLAGGNSLGYVNGGLDVVLSVLDKDSRFKTVSRPMVRVRSGAQARFAVGQDVPVLGQATLDKNGNPVQSVDYRQSGIILVVTPDVHADVIDLDISQELSSFVATTTGVNNSPTLLKRSVNSKLSVKSGEVVIFGGLNESKSEDFESRLFGLKMFGQSSGSDTEILVFVEAVRI